eukprot:m.250591 g.250591  ORF g.250591 m.250591 type:complete len:99 (+) comp15441_c0_seq2:2176-2472(+)
MSCLCFPLLFPAHLFGLSCFCGSFLQGTLHAAMRKCGIARACCCCLTCRACVHVLVLINLSNCFFVRVFVFFEHNLCEKFVHRPVDLAVFVLTVALQE